MVVYKSVEQVVRDMIKWAIGIGSQITDWSVGTPQRQIIEGAASEIETVNFQIKLLEKDSLVQTATGAGLDRKVGDFSMERLTQQKATTQIRFWAEALPGSDIPIPIKTRLLSKDGKTYETTASATFTMTQPLDTDSDLEYVTYGKYILDGVPARALEYGEQGNNGRGEIDSIVNPITGIDGAINTSPATGGFTTENDERLRNRALNQLSIIGKGVKDTYIALCFESDRRICANFQNDAGVLSCLVNNANWNTNCFDGTYVQCNQFTRHDRVLRARAVGGLRGTGTVDVFVVADEAGGVPPQWLLDRIELFLADYAPLGTDVKASAQIFTEYRPKMTVQKTAEFSGVFYNNLLKGDILKALATFCDYTTWNYGQDLLLTDLQEVLGAVRGVYDYTIDSINGGLPANVVLGPNDLPKFMSESGDLTILEFGGF